MSPDDLVRPRVETGSHVCSPCALRSIECRGCSRFIPARGPLRPARSEVGPAVIAHFVREKACESSLTTPSRDAASATSSRPGSFGAMIVVDREESARQKSTVLSMSTFRPACCGDVSRCSVEASTREPCSAGTRVSACTVGKNQSTGPVMGERHWRSQTPGAWTADPLANCEGHGIVDDYVFVRASNPGDTCAARVDSCTRRGADERPSGDATSCRYCHRLRSLAASRSAGEGDRASDVGTRDC